MNRDHSVVFEIASKYCISDSFVDHDGYSISSLMAFSILAHSSRYNGHLRKIHPFQSIVIHILDS